MKFYGAPGACSLGIHIVLEEVGASYDFVPVDLFQGEQFRAEFRRVNAKGKVPALSRDDGSVLTEFPAIAFWLARAFPVAGLLPEGLEAEVRALELIDFIVSSIHMQGFTLAKVAQKFVTHEEGQAQLRETGWGLFQSGLARLSDRLGEKDWFLGTYSIADAAAFYVLNWAERESRPLPGNLVAFAARMRTRPAVLAALQQEGLA